jgi:hypothetical protein
MRADAAGRGGGGGWWTWWSWWSRTRGRLRGLDRLCWSVGGLRCTRGDEKEEETQKQGGGGGGGRARRHDGVFLTLGGS